MPSSDQVVEVVSYIFESEKLSTEYIALKADTCHLPAHERCRAEDAWLASVALRMRDDSCDCEDCEESEKPCAMDCEADEPCSGCREARDYAEDARFAIDFARGIA